MGAGRDYSQRLPTAPDLEGGPIALCNIAFVNEAGEHMACKTTFSHVLLVDTVQSLMKLLGAMSTAPIMQIQ